MAACHNLIHKLLPHWDFPEAAIGWQQWRTHGEPIPAATWELLKNCDAALMAAITSKPAREAEAELTAELRGTGLRYQSPIVQLRRELDLFAGLRPISVPERDADFLIIRENTEGLYHHDVLLQPRSEQPEHPLWEEIGADRTVARSVESGGQVAVSLRVTTSYGWQRLLTAAAHTALARHSIDPNRRRTLTVTIADKPNILRESAQVISQALAPVAAGFPQITFEFANADVVAMHLLTDPGRFDVIVAENLIGDILSDLGAGLGGGLGVAASANIGEDFALFEPVHGSAPDIAGKGIANPAAFLLSLAMCIEHLAASSTEMAVAGKLRQAVAAALVSDPTPDLGGSATTAEFVAATASVLGHTPGPHPR